MWMINSGNLGLAALLTGEMDTASHALREELTLCRQMVVRPVVFEGLRGLAAVAAVHGDDERAATLVGAAEAHRHDQTEDAVEARLERAFFEPARTRFGVAAWNAAAREGSALTFDDAIAYALEEPPTEPQTAQRPGHVTRVSRTPSLQQLRVIARAALVLILWNFETSLAIGLRAKRSSPRWFVP